MQKTRVKCELSKGRCIRSALLFTLLIIGFIVPERLTIPVAGAGKADWNHKSFWYSPWGISGVHKGIDIFAAEGASVVSTTPGFVIYRGELNLGGNIVCALGPKWRIHYYAHLNSIDVRQWHFVHRGQKIGTVGTTGNAVGKPPHLHYAVVTPIPYVWRIGIGKQGWKKMFYLNPDELLRN